jgi:multidrug resistance protein, MATE family
MRPDLVKEVAHLAWPVILQGVLTTVVFFTDRLLLGTYSDEALGSMQISGPVLWSMGSILVAFATGSMAIIGRSVGAKDVDRARDTLMTSLYLAVSIGLLMTWLGLSTMESIADLMGGSPDTSQSLRDLAVVYMGVVFWAAPLSFIASSGIVALQASGDTRSPMWISAIAGVANLGISWALIFGRLGAPELGVFGAGIGTITSFALQAVLVLVILARSQGIVRLLPLRKPTLAPLRPIFRVSGPTFVERVIFHSAFLFFAGFVGHLGDVAMTANQSLIAIESLGFMVSFAFGVAASALVAQKLGAELPEDAAQCGWLATGMGAALLALIGLFFLIFAEELVGFFSDDPEVISLAATCLRVAAFAQPLMAITDALAGSLRGAGDTRSPMLVAIIGPVVVRLTACWLLAFEWEMGLLGIWIATTFDWTVRCVVLAMIFRRGAWKSIAV